MAITEVFKKPTVTKVLFEIRFPDFFSMESKIGDLQLKIMSKFPKSALLVKNHFLITQQRSDVSLKIDNEQDIGAKKIWQFKTEDESVIINITSSSLDITSTKHKTYNNKEAELKFRDIIEFVVGNLLEVLPLFKISRIGLRYLDDCPLPNPLTNDSFLEYYNSLVNFNKIENILNVQSFEISTVVNEGNLVIRCLEKMHSINEEIKYELDFDGHRIDIKPNEYLNITDEIHDVIVRWYENFIKEPVLKIMRNE